MRTIVLPGTGIETSSLGFGCATLFRVPGKRERRHLLEMAYSEGIRHFDVAPIYGLGAAERELGAFARARRDELAIATKFGIEPGRTARHLSVIQGPIRRLIRAFPSLRQQVRTRKGGLAKSRRYDAASARTSLEKSLRKLGTEQVDFLFLHEPSPGDVRTDDVAAYLEDARRKGQIRAWGIAGEPEPCLEVAQAFPVSVPVLQLRDNILMRTLDRLPVEPKARITFGAVASALAFLLAHFTVDSDRVTRWSQAIGADCTTPDTTAALLLRYALRSNPLGVVLYSTTQAERIQRAVAEAAADPTVPDPTLDAFLQLVDAELLGARSSTTA